MNLEVVTTDPIAQLLGAWSADLTVGNLETVFAKDRPYSGELTGFNAPAAYLDALKDCGFDVLVTANNHWLGRGTE